MNFVVTLNLFQRNYLGDILVIKSQI